MLAVVTKSDTVDRDGSGAQLLAVSELGEWAEVVPVSAVTGYQLELLGDLLVARLPVGPNAVSRTASSPTSRRRS